MVGAPPGDSPFFCSETHTGGRHAPRVATKYWWVTFWHRRDRVIARRNARLSACRRRVAAYARATPATGGNQFHAPLAPGWPPCTVRPCHSRSRNCSGPILPVIMAQFDVDDYGLSFLIRDGSARPLLRKGRGSLSRIARSSSSRYHRLTISAGGDHLPDDVTGRSSTDRGNRSGTSRW